MDPISRPISRRALLGTAAPAALAGTALASPSPALARTAQAQLPVEPFPLEAVRLEPSDFLTALQANRAYLLSLEPDRFLHNFREQAGLPPKAKAYGGWEATSLAGHSLGHYLSAVSLLHAQTGDPEPARRAAYIVSELALCQSRSPDGYIGALTYEKDGQQRPGHEMFEELRRGQIHATGFNLNGAWSPLYTVHKVMAGLLDAHRYCANAQALEVAERLGGYFDGVFAALTPAQVEEALVCEYGGLNESYAELYARTGERRWLAMAKRLYDHATLDPLEAGEDRLNHLHSNKQIPKVIGLARLHDITREPSLATARDAFWRAVVDHHSYVIGGNGDREYFQAPDSTSRYVTDQTCESCCSYNMLKLTRQVYAAHPDARLFDYYERAHLNHILAMQNPHDGMFCYMSPLMSGAHRKFSTPDDTFWCCVGTGMESHAKHGDSIYWRRGNQELRVNLFIPSTLTWAEERSAFRLSTDYPRSGAISFEVLRRTPECELTLTFRRPGWATGAAVWINGMPVRGPTDADGYIRLRRRWRAGDQVALDFDLPLHVEPTSDDPNLVAILHGPVVLAADLGPAEAPFEDQPGPALVGASWLQSLTPEGADAFRTSGAARPADLVLRPFNKLQDRRTAVYFPQLSEAGWAKLQADFAARKAALAALDRRSMDHVALGDDPSVSAHGLKSKTSYPVVYRRRKGRDARSGGYFEATLAVRNDPAKLRAAYWGEDDDRKFRITVDGTPIADETLTGDHPGVFFARDYPIAPELVAGRASVVVRFEPSPDHTAGPVFGLWTLDDAEPAATVV